MLKLEGSVLTVFQLITFFLVKSREEFSAGAVIWRAETAATRARAEMVILNCIVTVDDESK